jgi:hypothetical protein
MKKNSVEEIFCNRCSNELVCKKSNSLCDAFFTVKLDAVNTNLFCERFGETTISRQELESELNLKNSEKEANNFSLNP